MVNLRTLFRLLTQGFSSRDPRLAEEAEKLEKEEQKEKSTKETALQGYKRVAFYDDSFKIARWLRDEGREIKLQSPQEIEVWQKGEHFRLAVKTAAEWEVYFIMPELTCYRMRRRLV